MGPSPCPLRDALVAVRASLIRVMLPGTREDPIVDEEGRVTDELLDLMPFAKAVGVAIDAAEPGEVRGRLAWAADRCTAGGVLHGGALMTLADSLGGVCAYLNLPPGAGTTTISSSTAFLRGVRGGEVTGVARPLHAGRTVIVVQTDLRDDGGRLVAQVTQAQAVLGGASGASG
jgi:1,4-dihydroxy-2-naphthoyl-CoA hydrolase